jgi:hypothetical protein
MYNLHGLAKPEKDSLKDKECLICLELMESESLINLVKLPCGCANSTYHILCITRLLESGENKNFCPHCKTIYCFMPAAMPPSSNINSIIAELQTKHYCQIMMFHLLSNTIMNIANICITRTIPKYTSYPELQVMVMFYFSKIFFNYCILVYSNNNIDKIESVLLYSYMFQTVLFGGLLYAVSQVKNYNISVILLLNNVFSGGFDVAFRVIIENRMKNRVINM